MTDFAGRLRERVEILTRTPARDALGAPGEDWTLVDQVWANATPIGHGADYVADAAARPQRWRLTMRPCAVAVGDRLDRAGHMLDVQDVLADPAFPDRITVTGEVVR